MNKIVFVLLLICCATAVNCSEAVDPNHTARGELACTELSRSVESADGNDIKEAVAGNTDFTFALYGKLKDNDPNSNLFFSPYSISTALSMTYAGARGNTKKQMATALNFTLPGPRLHHTFGALQKQLVQNDKSRGYQLFLANALWGQKGEPVLKEFLNLTKDYYGAGLTLLDFVNETEESRQIINSWVEEKTKDKIKNLIPPGGVDYLTAMVLTNAIYFKGEWKTKFEEKDTELGDFAILEKDKIKVPFMHLKEGFKYYEDEKMRVLELPYKGNEISMLVFLPRETEGIKELENTLTAETLNVLLSKMQMEKIDVYLPKFKIVWGTFVLNDALIALGMPDAFKEREADFSGINGIVNDLYISGVFHQAFIEVNEEGTEAAAATGVVLSHSLPDVFCADHPFIFIIKDNRSGSILFMGRVMNPAE
jgi:serpin B